MQPCRSRSADIFGAHVFCCPQKNVVQCCSAEGCPVVILHELQSIKHMSSHQRNPDTTFGEIPASSFFKKFQQGVPNAVMSSTCPAQSVWLSDWLAHQVCWWHASSPLGSLVVPGLISCSSREQ